jgi:hypothetical protein
MRGFLVVVIVAQVVKSARGQEALPQNMPVYVFGFPFGQGLAAGRGNPSS